MRCPRNAASTPHPLVSTLQGDNRAARAVREFGVRIKTLSRRSVEHFKVPKLRRVFLHILEMRDEHAELRAPVSHVILPNHVVAKCLENARHGIPDGRPQVPHMHFLGEVRGGVVDDDPVGMRGSFDLDAAEVCADKRRRQRDVDEAGTGDCQSLSEVRFSQRSHDALGKHAWLGSCCPGSCHGAVRLVVAELWARGNAYHWLGVRDASRLERRLHALVQERPEIHSSWVETSSARHPGCALPPRKSRARLRAIPGPRCRPIECFDGAQRRRHRHRE